MSERATIVVSVSAVYLLICLALGMMSGRKASDSATGYVAGDRTLGFLVMYFITGATAFSAFAFLGGRFLLGRRLPVFPYPPPSSS